MAKISITGSLFSLEGKGAPATGASSGIGRAMAADLATARAAVVHQDRP